LGKSGGIWNTLFHELARRKECQIEEIEEGQLMSHHADIDPAEIFGDGGDRLPKRKELDLDCPGMWNASF
jgi:hypothetical protein